MFASSGVGQSAWDHPVVGYINGILFFLKNQVGARHYSSTLGCLLLTHMPCFSIDFIHSWAVTSEMYLTSVEGTGSPHCGTSFSPKNGSEGETLTSP
jgi:hypothetical protein